MPSVVWLLVLFRARAHVERVLRCDAADFPVLGGEAREALWAALLQTEHRISPQGNEKDTFHLKEKKHQPRSRQQRT